MTQTLRIPICLAVTGLSSGADDSVQMAVSYPGFMDGIFPISGGGLYTTQAFSFGSSFVDHRVLLGMEWRQLRRESQGLRIQFPLAYIPFWFTREWWEQYIDAPEAYTKWRNTQGEYYFDIQDARDLYYRQMADWRGWVGDTPGFNDDLSAILGSIKAKTLFLSNPRDQFVPKPYYETMVNAIPGARVVWIDSVPATDG